MFASSNVGDDKSASDVLSLIIMARRPRAAVAPAAAAWHLPPSQMLLAAAFGGAALVTVAGAVYVVYTNAGQLTEPSSNRAIDKVPPSDDESTYWDGLNTPPNGPLDDERP